MTAPLFREEVLKARRDRLYGELLLALPTRTRVYVALLVAAALLFAAVCAFGQVGPRATATGSISANTGVIRLSARGDGSVSEVLVQLGQHVRSGEPLVIVSEDVTLSDGDSMASRSLALLDSQRTQAEAQLQAVEARARQQQTAIEARLAALRREQNELDDELAFQQERLQLAQENEEAFRRLEERGFASRVQGRAARDALLAARQELASIQQRRAGLRRELRDVTSELASLSAETRLAQGPFDLRLSELESARVNLAPMSGYSLASPIDGIVVALNASPGGRIRTTDTMVVVLPENGRLEAELQVSSAAIGRVREGQRVVLFYDAYPYEQFGAGRGTVAEVSRAAVVVGGGNGEAPSQQAPTFRVRVRLEEPVVVAGGQQFHLQVGMTLRAAIIIENRRVWQVMLDPLRSAATRAFEG